MKLSSGARQGGCHEPGPIDIITDVVTGASDRLR
jgi:hypothetical protein